MTIGEMRKVVADAYPGKSWRYKVSRMSEAQVMAIYYSIRDRKEIAEAPPIPGQISIYDIMSAQK